MGGGGTTADRGESQELNSVEVVVGLETEMFSKYSDTASPNYKTLSKRIIQSVKSNLDQRKTLFAIKDY